MEAARGPSPPPARRWDDPRCHRDEWQEVARAQTGDARHPSPANRELSPGEATTPAFIRQEGFYIHCSPSETGHVRFPNVAVVAQKQLPAHPWGRCTARGLSQARGRVSA